MSTTMTENWCHTCGSDIEPEDEIHGAVVETYRGKTHARCIHAHVNVYEMGCEYCGPEEGGTYRDTGSPVASIPVDLRDQFETEAIIAWMRRKFPRTGTRRNIFSYANDYEVRIEPGMARAFPTEAWRYE